MSNAIIRHFFNRELGLPHSPCNRTPSPTCLCGSQQQVPITEIIPGEPGNQLSTAIAATERALHPVCPLTLLRWGKRRDCSSQNQEISELLSKSIEKAAIDPCSSLAALKSRGTDQCPESMWGIRHCLPASR